MCCAQQRARLSALLGVSVEEQAGSQSIQPGSVGSARCSKTPKCPRLGSVAVTPLMSRAAAGQGLLYPRCARGSAWQACTPDIPLQGDCLLLSDGGFGDNNDSNKRIKLPTYQDARVEFQAERPGACGARSRWACSAARSLLNKRAGWRR